MTMTHTGIKTTTVTHPRIILILSSIRLAYKHIMCYSDKKCKKWLDAFENKELESVTFYAVTNKDGEKKKLIELRMGIDWDKYTELVKLKSDVVLLDTPEHKQAVTVAISEAVKTYLDLFDVAREKFSDCESEAWYCCSSYIRADSDMWDQTRKKLGLCASSTPLPPYSTDVNDNIYDMPQLEDLHSSLKTYF